MRKLGVAMLSTPLVSCAGGEPQTRRYGANPAREWRQLCGLAPMMKTYTMSIMVGMTLAILQIAAAATPQQPVHAAIRGIVVGAGTDAPLAGAHSRRSRRSTHDTQEHLQNQRFDP